MYQMFGSHLVVLCFKVLETSGGRVLLGCALGSLPGPWPLCFHDSTSLVAPLCNETKTLEPEAKVSYSCLVMWGIL